MEIKRRKPGGGRKRTPDTQNRFIFRFEAILRQRVDNICLKQKKTVTGIIEQALIEFLEREETK